MKVLNYRGFWLLTVIALLLALSCTSAIAAVTGKIQNSSSRTGWAFISLKGTDNSYGTALKFTGNTTQSFTINGVPDGTYSVSAWLDISGTGIRHRFDPFKLGANVTVSGGNGVTGTVTLPTVVVSGLVKPSAPAVYPASGGGLVSFGDWVLNGLYAADYYKLTCGGTIIDNIPVNTQPAVYLPVDQGMSLSCTVTPKINGTLYPTYASAASAQVTVSDSTCAATPAGCAAGFTVNGRVSFPGITTNQDSYLVVVLTNIDKPSEVPVPYTALVNSFTDNSASFSIAGVPKGEYSVKAILDVDGNRILGAGDAAVAEMDMPRIIVDGKGIDEAGTVTVPDMALNLDGSVARVGTSHDSGIYDDPANPELYGLNFTILDADKVPVSVELQNLFSLPVVSLARSESGGFFYKAGNLSVPPYVGDTFDAAVTYSDGTTETRSMRVSAVLEDFARPTFISGNVRPNGTAQVLAWRAPQPAPGYSYSYRTTLAGIESPEIKSGNLSGSVPVTTGQAYNWLVSVFDSLGNSASTSATFTTQASGPSITGFTPVTGPVGTTVTINGSEFVSGGSNVAVSFNGAVALPSDIITVTDSQIQVTVPVEASTGPILVTVGGETAISSAPFTPTIAYSGTIKDVNGNAITSAKVRKIGNSNSSAADTGNFTLLATGYSDPDTAIPAGVPFELKIFDADASPVYRTSYTSFLTSLTDVTGAAIELVNDSDLDGWAVTDIGFTDVKTSSKGMIRGRVLADVTGEAVSGAKVSIKSRFHPDQLPATYAVYYTESSAPHSPVAGEETSTSGRFYVVGIDEGDVITANASTTNGFSFAPAAWQVRAGAISQGDIRGDMDPAYISVMATPPAGSYNEPQSVTLTASPSATIYYTTSKDADPRLNGIKYTGAITVADPTPLTYVVKNSIGKFGTPESSYYYINTAFTVRAVPPGSIAPAGGGTYKPTSFPVALKFKANRAATIYYTTNGSDPTDSPHTLAVDANVLSASIAISIDPTILKFYAKEQSGSQSRTDVQAWTFSSGGASSVSLALEDSYKNQILNGGTAYGVVTATATVSPSAAGKVLFIVDGTPRWPKVDVVNGVAQTSLTGLPALGANHTIQANYYDLAGTQTANSPLLTIMTAKALFRPEWWTADNPPADITYGTPLSHIQLNAKIPAGAPVTGTFIYDPPYGTILNATLRTLKAKFVPDDMDSFQSVEVSAELDVIKATPTISWGNPAGITYGELLSTTQLNASLLGYDGNVISSVCTYDPTFDARLDAGAKPLSVSCRPSSFADLVNYDSQVSKGVTINVAKAPLTVSAEPASRVYGDANPDFTPKYTGFVGADTASVLTGSPSFTTTALPTSKVGSYSITAAKGTLASNNYELSYTPGLLTVEKAVITVAAKDILPADFIYNYSRDYGEANPVFAAAYSGFKNGQTLATSGITGKPDFATNAEITSPPNIYYIKPSIGSLAAVNYSFTFVDSYLQVKNYPSKVTVTSSKISSVYGNNLIFTATVTPTIANGTVQFKIDGVDMGDPVALVNGVAVSAPVNKPVGIYKITAVYGGESREFIIDSNPVTITTIAGSTSAVITQTVTKAAQTITFPAIPNKAVDAAPFNPGASASSGLPITYTVTGQATYNSGTGNIELTGIAGIVTIKAAQAGSGNYNAALPVTRSFYVRPQTQTITFGPLAAKTYGDATFTLSATSNNAVTQQPTALGVTFTSSNPAVATVFGKTVTIRGAGTTTITALQAGSITYAAAEPVTQTLTVAKKGQAVTFAVITDKTYGTLPFALTATATSNLPVSFSIVSGPATVSGRTLTITGSGTVVVRASQVGNGNFEAAADVDRTFVVNKVAANIITFAALAARPCVNNGTFTLIATATSKLPVTYASSNPAVATVSGNVVTIKGVGTTNITASQAASDNYPAATDVVRALFITKGTQAIAFPAIANKPVNAEPFDLNATASSGLPVTYRIVSGPASVSGSTVTLNGTVGTAIVEATQIGDGNFNPALPVRKTFYVRPQDQTITFGPLAAKTYGDAAFKLSATSDRGLTVTYTSSNSAVATVSGSTVTIRGAGVTTITASQIGNATYAAAPPVSQALTVDKKALTVTAANKVKYLNSVNPALTYTYSGFAYGQTLPYSGVKGVPKLATTAVKDSSIGDYPITVELNTLVSNNYSFNLVDGTLSVVLP